MKRISVPLYDELSVIRVWPMMKDDEKISKFFPTKMAKGRMPDREYFYNIVNTFHHDYLAELLRHANKQRNDAATEALAKETIEISDDWWELLNSVPFISRK